MKFFVVFFLLFFVSYGHSQSAKTTAVPSETISSQEALTLLRNQLKRYVNSLMLILLDENTPRENQREILDEIKAIADINGKITVAMNQISQSGIEQRSIDMSKDRVRDEDISVWAKNQAELIRRKQLALNELEKREKDLDKEFWVNLALDGVVIVAGGVLFFIPAVGPAVSIPLTAGRLTLTGQRLGALLMGAGGLRSGWDIWSYLFGEEERLRSFVSDIAFRDVLTKELFRILSSANPGDRYLAINLLRSASLDEETLTRDLLNAVQDETHSAGVRQSAIRALKAVSVDQNEGLRQEVMGVLKGVIDESQIPSLREVSVLFLGEIGEGLDEVALYLKGRGEEVDESDELRLLALLQSGRNKEYFLFAIGTLAEWLEDRNYYEEPLNIQPEIPDSFLEFLLPVKSWKGSRNYIIVVKEFLLSGILNAKLKIRFSEALLSWDDGLESKVLLREVYSNPARDIRLYVENDLFKEGLSEENYGAFQFLINSINVLEEIKAPAIVVLHDIESIIEELKKEHSNQMETAKKLEEIVHSYKKTLETIEN